MLVLLAYLCIHLTICIVVYKNKGTEQRGWGMLRVLANERASVISIEPTRFYNIISEYSVVCNKTLKTS